MTATFIKETGTVKFFDQAKGFGFIATEHGDIFINKKVAGEHAINLVKGAAVVIDFVTYYERQYRRDVTTLWSVVVPPAPAETTILTLVDWYNKEKGFGFINCVGHNLSREQAFLHASVCEAAGIIPGKDMPVLARIIEAPKGLKVISFEYGEAIDAQWRAKLETEAKDGAPPVSEPEAPAKKPATKKVTAKAPKKPAAKKAPAKPAKKPAAKKVKVPVADMITAGAASLNGSGGAMAAAMEAAASAH